MRRVSPPVQPAEGGELDVVDGAPRSLAGSSDQLGLEQRVHGFGEGVVVGVADRPDRRHGADVVEAFAVADAGGLAAGVGVGDEPFEAGASVPAGRLQCVEHHLGCHVAGDAPADDAAGERVGDEAHIGDPGPGGDLGEVRDPQPVRGIGGEVAVDEIGWPCRLGVRHGGAHPLFPPHAPDIELFHEPGDLVAADIVPDAPCRDPQLARPAGPSSSPATSRARPASAQRRAMPEPTAGGAWRTNTWKGPSAAQRRRARPRSGPGWHR